MRTAAALLALLIAATTLQAAGESKYFRILVVDQETGRGVPLVELRTTGDVRHVTDSAGVVAFHEPGLMGREVHFAVKSHGYEVAADGFGFRGFRARPVGGKGMSFAIRRVNVAERLYRVTGQGIYRDSVLLGEETPLSAPLLAGGVIGQDSVQVVPYRRKLFWLWGDTALARHPLGNFGASSAFSLTPQSGGLDPAVGVDLEYFVDERGDSRPMCRLDGPGAIWIDGLMSIEDDKGVPRLVGHFVRVKSLTKVLERGLVVFDDKTQMFTKLVNFPIEAPLHPHGRPVEVVDGGERYYAFGRPFPNVRVRADMRAVKDPARYEAFTPWSVFPEGTVLDSASPWLTVPARKRSGVSDSELLLSNYPWKHLRDVSTGEEIEPHGGTVHWNAYRRRWIAIVLEKGGTSMLGEVWYVEADTLTGPWVYARKIVTHDRYSFYHPMHHPWFDQDGGRLVYLEGTYTATFSGAQEKTPRYDYNQVMYRLDLDDPRLRLPAPVYRLRDGDLATRAELEAAEAWPRVEGIAFFAADKPLPRFVPLRTVGYGLSVDEGRRTPVTVPVYRTRHTFTLNAPEGGEAIAHVWPNPIDQPYLDVDLRPAPSR